MKRRGFFGLLAGLVMAPVAMVVAKPWIGWDLAHEASKSVRVTATEVTTLLNGADDRFNMQADSLRYAIWEMKKKEWTSEIKQPVLYPRWYQDQIMKRVFSGDKLL